MGWKRVAGPCHADRLRSMDRLREKHEWRELHRWLEAEREKALAVHLESLIDDLAFRRCYHGHLLQVERDLSESVDNAILQFAGFGTWPALSRDAAGLARQRFDTACGFLDAMLDTDSLQSGLDPLGPRLPGSREKVLEFLLVDLWEAQGRDPWRNWILAGCH